MALTLRLLECRWQVLNSRSCCEETYVHEHSWASQGVMNGVGLYTVGRLLDHADTASTERYAHLADSHVRAAAGRISGIVNDAMTGSTEEAGHEQ